MNGNTTATIDGVTLNAATGQWIVRYEGAVIAEVPTQAIADTLYAAKVQAADDVQATEQSERYAARLEPAS